MGGSHRGAPAAAAARIGADAGAGLDGVARIVGGGDFGDSYNYAPPHVDSLIETPASVSVRALAAGPLRARLAVERLYEWPVGLSEGGVRRAGETQPTLVTTEVELRAGG